jgi:ubiquitin C-terminal hydrolase
VLLVACGCWSAKLTLSQRFEYRHGRHDRAASKVDNEVKFPLQLNMLPYTNRVRNHESRESLELERSCTYDLLSVVVHVGEIDTGHYTSYCRVGDQVGFILYDTVSEANISFSGSNLMTTKSSWRACLTCLAPRPISFSTLFARWPRQ